MTDSVQKLARRIKASNDAAFDQLFRLLYNDMVRYAMTFTRDKDQACNVAQDVFIKLWQIRDQIDLEKSLKAFLFQMVRNKSLNLLRDTRREVTGLELADLQHEDLITGQESTSGEESDHVEQTGYLTEKLHEWVEQLPERQREAFELSRFEGLDHEEIAQVMQVSARTVNNHLVAALRQLRIHYDMHIGEKSRLVV